MVGLTELPAIVTFPRSELAVYPRTGPTVKA